MADVLQSVRAHRKVDLAVDVPIHIDQTPWEVFDVGVIPFCQCRYCSWLVNAVMINWCVRGLLDRVHKLLPYVALVVARIRPKRLRLRGVGLTYPHANHII